MQPRDKVILNLIWCTPERKEELKKNVIKDAYNLEGTIINYESGKYKVKWGYDNKEIEYLMNESELVLYSRFMDGRNTFKILGLGGGKKARKSRKSKKVRKSRKSKKVRKSRKMRRRIRR